MARAATSRVNTGIDVAELKAFRRSLREREDGKTWMRSLQRASKEAGQVIVDEAQQRARAMGGQQAASAPGIKAAANQLGVSIRISRTSRSPYALAAFWGATRKSGWYARPRYDNSPPQFRPWVGASWDVGVMGEGPYAVNPAIAVKKDEVMDLWAESITKLLDDALDR